MFFIFYNCPYIKKKNKDKKKKQYLLTEYLSHCLKIDNYCLLLTNTALLKHEQIENEYCLSQKKSYFHLVWIYMANGTNLHLAY